jgi:hypothetical protein
MRDANARAPERTGVCIICLMESPASVCDDCLDSLAAYLGRPYWRDGLAEHEDAAAADREARAPLFVEGRRALAKQHARHIARGAGKRERGAP